LFVISRLAEENRKRGNGICPFQRKEAETRLIVRTLLRVGKANRFSWSENISPTTDEGGEEQPKGGGSPPGNFSFICFRLWTVTRIGMWLSASQKSEDHNSVLPSTGQFAKEEGLIS